MKVFNRRNSQTLLTNKLALLCIIIFSFLSCNRNENTEQKSIPTDTITEINTDTIPKKNIIADNKNWKHKDVIVATLNSDYNSKFNITISKIQKDTNLIELLYEIDFSEFKGTLTSGTYHSTDSYFPVQLSKDLKKVYFSLYDEDLMEDKIYWSKLFEYDVETKKLKTLFTLKDEWIHTWVLNETNNNIVLFQYGNNTLVSIDLNSLNLDTLYKFKEKYNNIEFFSNHNNIEILYFLRKKGVFQYLIDKQTLEVQEKFLYKANGFSSLRNDYLIETDYRGTNKIILYSPSEQKEINYDFRNTHAHWLSDDHFVINVDKGFTIFDKNLEIAREVPMPNSHIFEMLEDCILIQIDKTLYLYSKDFNHRFEIQAIKSNNLQLVTSVD